MSNITTTDNHAEYIEKHLDLIQNQNKLSKSDLDNFALQCKRTGLDPITRQIYAIPSGGKLNIMASIDGLRLIAERSGQYEGQTAPQWCGDDGVWKDVWLSKETPKACKLGVYKTKFREALFGVALFDEYAGKQNGKLTFMWAKMPALMIAKVAEALALRKAFPNEMSGIYSDEEMQQAGEQFSNPQGSQANGSGAPKEKEATKTDPELTTGKDLSSFEIKRGKADVKFHKLSEISIPSLKGWLDFFDKPNPRPEVAIEIANVKKWLALNESAYDSMGAQ